MNFPWMRRLIVKFDTIDGSKPSFILGDGEDALALDINCSKYLASSNDEATIVVYNLSYSKIIQLVSGNYFYVEIQSGYKNTSMTTIFKGGIIYMENVKTGNNTTKMTISCACMLKAIPAYRERLSLPFNSGLNLWSALNELNSAFGISNSKIDESLKNITIPNAISERKNAGEWVDYLVNTSRKFFEVNSDSVKGAIYTIREAKENMGRVSHKILTSDINISSLPTITTEGLKINLVPIYEIAPGDAIILDNTAQGLIKISGSSLTKNYGWNLDKDGTYIIYQINYSLCNRDDDFNMELLGKAQSKYVTDYVRSDR